MQIKLNPHFAKLQENYLFSEIAARVRAYTDAHPDADMIRLGIGDVTLPLAPCVVEAMREACAELEHRESFRGYPPEQGYAFLREAIAAHYVDLGAALSPEEIFVSDGAKSDAGNLVELFGNNPVFIPDPVYPAYLDANIMAGRRVRFLHGTADNGFLPSPDRLPCRPCLIYLCSPNNPTGAVYDSAGLAVWVAFAQKSGSLLLFDAAYEAFVCDGKPRSIFCIEGARSCAIEICSLSKSAGFTGVRCAWTVIPHALKVGGQSLAALFARRQAAKFNGVSYPVQRGAEAALSAEGKRESQRRIAYYRENARALAALFSRHGLFYTGGESSPYLWLRCPDGLSSWAFFDLLLQKIQVIGTPGVGFGAGGEGYFRLTAFSSAEKTAEAIARLEGLLA